MRRGILVACSAGRRERSSRSRLRWPAALRRRRPRRARRGSRRSSDPRTFRADGTQTAAAPAAAPRHPLRPRRSTPTTRCRRRRRRRRQPRPRPRAAPAPRRHRPRPARSPGRWPRRPPAATRRRSPRRRRPRRSAASPPPARCVHPPHQGRRVRSGPAVRRRRVERHCPASAGRLPGRAPAERLGPDRRLGPGRGRHLGRDAAGAGRDGALRRARPAGRPPRSCRSASETSRPSRPAI